MRGSRESEKNKNRVIVKKYGFHTKSKPERCTRRAAFRLFTPMDYRSLALAYEADNRHKMLLSVSGALPKLTPRYSQTSGIGHNSTVSTPPTERNCSGCFHRHSDP